jgi:hypothetical protein
MAAGQRRMDARCSFQSFVVLWQIKDESFAVVQAMTFVIVGGFRPD